MFHPCTRAFFRFDTPHGFDLLGPVSSSSLVTFAIGQDNDNSQPQFNLSCGDCNSICISNYLYMLMVIVGLVAHDCKDMKHRSP